jgi:hypothetical protein
MIVKSRTPRRAHPTCAVAIVAGTLLVSSVASAQQREWRPGQAPAQPPDKAAIDEARRRYTSGIRLYEEGNADAAVIELERSYDTAPSYRVLYNIGIVARTRGDYVTSLRAFERYLADGGLDVPASRKAEVEKEIATLRGRIARIEITVDVDGASIAIDGFGIGKSPLAEPALMSAGHHTVLVTKDALTRSQSVSVAGGDALKLPFVLAPKEPAASAPAAPTEPPIAAAPAPSAPSPAPPPPVAPSRTPAGVWIGAAATGALAIGAGVFGGLALKSSSDLKDARFVGDQPGADVDRTKSHVQTYAIVTDVLAGSAVLALGITLYVAATSDSHEQTKTGYASPPVELKLGLGGGAVRGRF